MEKWVGEILNSFKKDTVNSDSNLYLVKGKTGTGKTTFGLDLGIKLSDGKNILVIDRSLSDLGIRNRENFIKQYFYNSNKISATNKLELEKLNSEEGLEVLILDSIDTEDLDFISNLIKKLYLSEFKVILIGNISIGKNQKFWNLPEDLVEKFNTIYSKIE